MLNVRQLLTLVILVCIMEAVQARGVPVHHAIAHASDTVAGNILWSPLATVGMLIIGLVAALI